MLKKNPPFVFFNTIDDIPKGDWNLVVADRNIFLSLAYLETLTRSLSNEINWIFVLVYADSTPIVAGVFQLATFTYKKGAQTNLLLKLFQDCKNADDNISIHGLVCGNIFATGAHGFTYAPDITLAAATELMASAAKLLRKEKKYEDAFSIQLFKDFDLALIPHLDVLEDFKYRSFQADVAMLLPIHKRWQTFSDYLNSLKAKYRTKANSAFKKSGDIQIKSLSASEIEQHENRLLALFQSVQDQSAYSYGRLYPTSFKALKDRLGELFICKGAFLDDTLIGFSTAFRNGNTLEASYVGLNYTYNATYALYERLLYNYVEEAIQQKVTSLHLGRTSELIKSALGATPHPMTLFAKHSSKFKNILLKPLLDSISPSEFELRKPFKASYYLEN